MRGPGPITWDEAQRTLLLLAEERVGAPIRRHARMMRASEDARAAALLADMNGEPVN